MQIKRLCYNGSMGKKYRGGFTLIELSLSLIFIAILSLMVVFLIMNVSSSYRRGLILNQINTVGMDLIDDFRISVQNATSDPVTRMCEVYYPDKDDKDKDAYNDCVNDHANSFVSVYKKARVTINKNVEGREKEFDEDIPVYGAFCTGTYTYVWNSGYFEDAEEGDFSATNMDKREVKDADPARVVTKEKDSPDFNEKYSGFRLLKIYDDERSICVNEMKIHDKSGNNERFPRYIRFEEYDNNVGEEGFVISDSMKVNGGEFDAVELMKKDETNLVLYEFYVAKPALSPTRQNLFYAGSFILGTRRGGIDITVAGNSCRPPNDEYTELEYCAINKFNFAVMAGGSKK